MVSLLPTKTLTIDGDTRLALTLQTCPLDSVLLNGMLLVPFVQNMPFA